MLLRYKLYLDYAITHMMATVTPPPEDKKYPNINSATSGETRTEDYGILGEKISLMIQDILVNLAKWLIEILEPFVLWGCKLLIVICFIAYYWSQDKRCISTAIKFGTVFLIFNILRSVIM